MNIELPQEYETSPESRLWAAYLLSILRDMVPRYVTRKDPLDSSVRTYSISRMGAQEFDRLTTSHVFELGCEACNLAPSFVRGKMSKLRLLDPSVDFIEEHNLKYPEGGLTPLIRVHQYFVEDFFDA